MLRLFFAALVFTACKSKTDSAKLTPKASPPTIVDVMIAEPQVVNPVVEANGTVVANEYVELHPEVSGRLTYLNIAEGSHITEGTIIARINDADLKAQVAKSKVQLNLAEKTEERYKELLAINGINQSDYDAILNQVNGYKADIVYTESLIDKTVIRAPFSGITGLRQVSPGAFVTPTTTLVTLQQTSQVKIDFTLPELYGNIIKKGLVLDIELDASSDKKNKAIVIATEPVANTNTRNLKVRAILQNGTANPGAFVKVFINVGIGRSSIKVPTNCLIPDDKNNQLVLVKKGLANFVNVQTGLREANAVEITQGVNVGDTVIVRGVLFARPKSAVKVRSVKKLDEFLNAGGK